jgi:hypothetical protein
MTAAVRGLIGARLLQARRNRAVPGTPARLAARCIRGYTITPTVCLLSDLLARAVTEPDGRYIISCPPRTGKSVLGSQVMPVWALLQNPDTELIVKSYGDELAEEHSREARRLLAGMPGIELAQDKSSVGRWRVAGRRGGMLAGGILSGTTGFGADLLIVDDPVRGASDADSAASRRRLLAEFKASLLSRVHPGGSVVIISSRFHAEDLAGSLLAEPGSPWRHVNIPAISEAGVPDALNRLPGVAMVSALGRTKEGFEEIRRAVGQRAWAGMYLGVPGSPEGGLVKRQWFDAWRLPAAPAGATRIVVGVDPADSGQGDETGIVACSLTRAGVVILTADASGHYTSDQWSRRAVELADTIGASEISVESFSAGTTYTRLVREAVTRHKPRRPIRVTSWPPKGSGRGKGDAVGRASGLLAALETGRARIGGHLPELEAQAVSWQAGSHQPDRVAAAVVAFDVCDHAHGQRVSIAAPAFGERIVAGERRHAWLFDSAPPAPQWMRERIVGRSPP